MTAETRSRRETFAGKVRKLDAALDAKILACRMFDGSERLVLDEHRLAAATAGGRARGRKIIKIYVKQKNIAIGEIGDIDPFAPRCAIELNMHGDADGRRRGSKFKDDGVGVLLMRIAHFEVCGAGERLGDAIRSGRKVQPNLAHIGQSETLAG